MKHLSLCTGIGGLDLAAEWAGFETVAQCEIDEYASKVLSKKWGGVQNLHDIRTVTYKRLGELGIVPEDITVVSAGFPCQPYSLAGKGKGDRDERDLWGEVARVLGEIKPRWFVGENTPGLFSRENQRYFRRILSDLTEMGYRVGWGIWGARDVGAPHKRDRVFLLAHANGERRGIFKPYGDEACAQVGNAETKASFGASGVCGNLSDADSGGQQKCGVQRLSSIQSAQIRCPISDAHCAGKKERQQESDFIERCFGVWQAEPDVGRVAHGVSARVDKLRCLGNAVVPYQAYPIFEAIAEFERMEE